MKAFDAWLIERHEHFAHWFQRLTGLTNFWLCKAMFMLFILSPLGHIAPLTWIGRTDMLIANFFFIVISGLGLLARKRVFAACDLLDDYYAEGRDSAHPGTLTAREYWQVRIFMMAGLLLLGTTQLSAFAIVWQFFSVPLGLMIVALLFVSLWWAAVPHVYFLICVPLPPGKSKVQSWLESFQPKPELKEAKIPVR